MGSYSQVFLASVTFANTLRLLLSPNLWRAPVVYCRRAGWVGRVVLRRRLRYLAEDPDVRFGTKNFQDTRAERIIRLTARFHRNEPNRHLSRFYQQAMGWDIYEAIGLIQSSEMMSPALRGPTCVLVPASPFAALLRDSYATVTGHLAWCFPEIGAIQRCRRFASYAVKIAHAFGRSILRRSRADESGSPGASALCVREFRGGQSLTARSDLFWLGARRPGCPVVFERATEYPVSDQFLADLRDRGVRVVRTTRQAPHHAGCDTWRPGRLFLSRSMRSGATLVRRLAAAPFVRARWLAFWKAWQAFHFEMLVNERYDFYLTYGIRAEFRSGFLMAEPAHSYALVQVGGISCGAQYSVGIDHLASHTSTSTFHLNFGDSITKWNFPLFADTTIFNGYIFKTPLAASGPQVEELRATLARAGVRRSVCFLDEGFTLPKVRAATLRMYERLLEWVVRDADFGVVLKPKKNESRRVLESEMGPLYRQAIATGRLLILDWNCYPGAAGLCADLTVGIMSTAAHEAAIMGCRTIYLNTGDYFPSFVNDIRQNIFESVPELTAAIEKFFGARETSDVGRHAESFLASVDHCRDLEVSDRIEYLLTTFLREIDAGKPRETAIHETMRGLTARWKATTLGAYSRTATIPAA